MLDNFRRDRESKNAEITKNEEKAKLAAGMKMDEDPPRRQIEEEKKEESSQRTRQNDMYLTKADSDLEIIHQAALLAPILDRVGRLLSDLTPQLNNIVR